MNELIIFDLEIVCVRIEHWIAKQVKIEKMSAGYDLIGKCRRFQKQIMDRSKEDDDIEYVRVEQKQKGQTMIKEPTRGMCPFCGEERENGYCRSCGIYV